MHLRAAFAAAAAGMLACATPVAAQDSPAVAAMDHARVELRAAVPDATAPPPKFQYLFAPNARWKGPVRWKYNHANAPGPLAADKAAIIAQIAKAFEKWSSLCGVTYAYDGETTVSPAKVAGDTEAGPLPDGVSVVGWGPLDSALGGWAYAWYRQDGDERVLVEADVTLSITGIATMSELDPLTTHEWGHVLGLDHSNTESAIMAGPPSTHYNALVTPQPDDIRGCRCAYGLPPGMSAPYACSLPPQVDFGSALIGTAAPMQRVTFTNSGNAPLSIESSTVTDARFRHVAGCTPGTVVMPAASCTLEVSVTPDAQGGVTARLALFTNDGFYELPLAATGVPGTPPEPASSGTATVDVIEYYNATLDHYFITWIAAEIAHLDAGRTPTRWTRTGHSFKAYATPQPGTSEVCRFYIPPADGNSHFFGRSADECAASQRANPDFVLEDPRYMQMFVPAAGACQPGTRPVYRVFNNRSDANHRYTTDRALRDRMADAGWTLEGDGADRVVMCAPQ
jgi:hypothetical protein